MAIRLVAVAGCCWLVWLVVVGCCGWLLLVAVAGCCWLLWLVILVCCGWLLLVAVAVFCCYIFLMGQNNMVFIHIYSAFFSVGLP